MLTASPISDLKADTRTFNGSSRTAENDQLIQILQGFYFLGPLKMIGSHGKRDWTLIVELWNPKQDASVLSGLMLLRPPLLPSSASLLASSWAYGHAKPLSIATSADLIQGLSEYKMNQVQVKCNSEGYLLPKTSLRIHAIRSTLFVSPTSELWANTRGYKGNSRIAENMRLSFESWQIAGRKMSNWPTVVRTEVNLRNGESLGEVQSALLPILAATLARSRIAITWAGCADLYPTVYDEHDIDCYPICGVQASVGHGQKVFHSLMTKWDALHPFLIGPYTRCSMLSRLLRIPTKLRKLSSGTANESLGVVALHGRGWHYQKYKCGREWLKRPAWGEPAWYAQTAPLLIPVELIGK